MPESSCFEAEDVPLGWQTLPLSEVVSDDKPVTYGIVQAGPHIDGGVPIIKSGDVTRGQIHPERLQRTSMAIARKYTRSEVRRGDLVFSIRASVGAVAEVPNALSVANLTQGTARISPGPMCDGRFLLHYLRSDQPQTWVQDRAKGVTFREITLATLRQLPVTFPPLPEQRRIVAKLESLQARSRRAREALEAVPALLEKLRQSILAAAFRGDLTADWRAQHPDVEPASELLKRIRIERRKKWEEAELAKLKAKGKNPTDNKWKQKYVEPEPVDDSDLPELPEGWGWASVEELAHASPRAIQSGPFGSSLLHSEFQSSGVLAIGIDNVQDGWFSLGAEHRISETKFLELEKFAARPGDVLITVMATVGRCCVAPDNLERSIITKHIYRITPERRLVLPKYVMHAMRGAPVLREAMTADLRGQTRPGLNGEILRALPVPVAPIPEQHAILRVLNAAFLTTQRMNVSQSTITELIASLDSSILSKAFRGELVPQDPNDVTKTLADAQTTRDVPAPAQAKRTSSRRLRHRP